MHPADMAVVGIYLVGIAAIGIRSGRRIRLSADVPEGAIVEMANRTN